MFDDFPRTTTEDEAAEETLKPLTATLKVSDTRWTYKALGGVIHQAELESLLIFKSFSQGVSQAVGGQHALPALLELAEYTLEKHNKQKKNKQKWTGVKLNLVAKLETYIQTIHWFLQSARDVCFARSFSKNKWHNSKSIK